MLHAARSAVARIGQTSTLQVGTDLNDGALVLHRWARPDALADAIVKAVHAETGATNEEVVAQAQPAVDTHMWCGANLKVG